jgi:hypothetical protein
LRDGAIVFDQQYAHAVSFLAARLNFVTSPSENAFEQAELMIYGPGK